MSGKSFDFASIFAMEFSQIPPFLNHLSHMYALYNYSYLSSQQVPSLKSYIAISAIYYLFLHVQVFQCIGLCIHLIHAFDLDLPSPPHQKLSTTNKQIFLDPQKLREFTSEGWYKIVNGKVYLCCIIFMYHHFHGSHFKHKRIGMQATLMDGVEDVATSLKFNMGQSILRDGAIMCQGRNARRAQKGIKLIFPNWHMAVDDDVTESEDAGGPLRKSSLFFLTACPLRGEC